MGKYVSDERTAFVTTMRAAAPEAPTLCGDWNTAQLCAHLVLRERSLVELGGRVPVASLQRRAGDAIDAYVAEVPYSELINRFSAGAPRYSPWSIPGFSDAVNLLEYTVHHEDVRRAMDGVAPRTLSLAQQQAVWSRLRMAARVTLRQVPQSVRLVWPSHGEVVTRRKSERRVTVSGDPVELALVVMGRQRVAKVTYDGPPDEVAQFSGARIAI